MNKLKNRFFNKDTAQVLVVWILFAVAYAAFSKPFWLNLVNGISIAAFIVFGIGMIRLIMTEGSFAIYAHKAKKQPFPSAYKERIKEERKNTNNPWIYAGLEMIALGLIMTWIYTLIF